VAFFAIWAFIGLWVVLTFFLFLFMGIALAVTVAAILSMIFLGVLVLTGIAFFVIVILMGGTFLAGLFGIPGILVYWFVLSIFSTLFIVPVSLVAFIIFSILGVTLAVGGFFLFVSTFLFLLFGPTLILVSLMTLSVAGYFIWDLVIKEPLTPLLESWGITVE
jgi:hypothetical protein